MYISEVIAMLEEAKEKYGDLQLVQSCSSEGLTMPIRGVEEVTEVKTGEVTALALDDNEEDYFGGTPPIEERK